MPFYVFPSFLSSSGVVRPFPFNAILCLDEGLPLCNVFCLFLFPSVSCILSGYVNVFSVPFYLL